MAQIGGSSQSKLLEHLILPTLGRPGPRPAAVLNSAERFLVRRVRCRYDRMTNEHFLGSAPAPAGLQRDGRHSALGPRGDGCGCVTTRYRPEETDKAIRPPRGRGVMPNEDNRQSRILDLLENKLPFSGLPSFLRKPYTRDVSQSDLVVLGVPFDGGCTNRAGPAFPPVPS